MNFTIWCCLLLHLFQVSWPLLGIPLSLHTVTALVAICAAVVIYAQVATLFHFFTLSLFGQFV